MTKEEREEAIAIIRKEYLCVDRDCDIERNCGKCDLMIPSKEPILKAYKMAIQALEQEPCDDAISREDALMALTGEIKETDTIETIIARFGRRIRKLSSVNPQPKTGHWEWVQYDYNPKLGNWHCSECRCVVVECVDKEEKGGIPLYKYCPQCGAKMVEPQESEEV